MCLGTDLQVADGILDEGQYGAIGKMLQLMGSVYFPVDGLYE